MAVAIRLTRVGATKRPAYRVVAIEKRRSRDGRALEILGYYDPLTDPATVKLDTDKIKAWIGKGAMPSDTVSRLMRQAEAEARGETPAPKRTRAAKPSKKAQSKAAAAAAAPEEAPAEAVTEAAAEAPVIADEAPAEPEATEDAVAEAEAEAPAAEEQTDAAEEPAPAAEKAAPAAEKADA